VLAASAGCSGESTPEKQRDDEGDDKVGQVDDDADGPAAERDAGIKQTQDARIAVQPDSGNKRDATTPTVDAAVAETSDAAMAAPGADSGANDAGPAVVATGPTLPAITDPAAAGPFGVNVVSTAPGLTTHTLYIPGELGKDGTKHPIIVWTNGNGGSASFYDAFLRHFASHGFFMVVDKTSTSQREMEYQHQRDGIEWAVKEAARTDGPYAGKLDGSRLGIMGHSMGSLSSFVNAGDKRLKTTMHWSGGLVGNPTGTDESAITKMHAPAAFMCGGTDTMAGPACANDFRDAPKGLPVFYGTLAGVGHLGVFSDRNGGEYGRMGVAWMRWKLADDESFKSYFAGTDCKACARPWTGMSRNL
jgi:dienelactone hydrolase